MDAKPGQSGRRAGGALPRFLLLAVLAAVGGAYVWASFLSPDGGMPGAYIDDGPAVDLRLARTKPKAAAQPTPPSRVTTTAKPPGDGAVSGKSAAKTAGRATIVASTPVHGTPSYSLPRLAKAAALAAAPDPALVQSTQAGFLPAIAKDGRQPWKVYARPFDASDKRPRIAIVITGLGHHSAAAEAAITALPGTVTLAFAPYAKLLKRRIGEARAAGHEVLLAIPMEPVNYPAYDPGPRALLTTLSPKENMSRLRWALGRVSGYVGVVDLMGSRFTASRNRMRPVLGDLKQRGLMYFDSRSSPRSAVPEIAGELRLAWASNTRMIDDTASRHSIAARLAELERIARDDGHAIGMGSPLPVTLEGVARWAAKLESRGIVLAPVTALTRVGTTE